MKFVALSQILGLCACFNEKAAFAYLGMSLGYDMSIYSHLMKTYNTE